MLLYAADHRRQCGSVRISRSIVIIVNPDQRFCCCSFAVAAATAAATSLSSIADAPAVAVDRSTTVVAAFRIQNMKIMTNRLIDCRSDCRC